MMGNNLYNQKQRNQTKKGNLPAKRVNIVRLQMVKECSVLYKNRVIRSPEDGYELIKQFLGGVAREYCVFVCLVTMYQSTYLYICLIGHDNYYLVKDKEDIMNKLLLYVNREHYVVVCIYTNNHPTSLNVFHIGSLNSSVVHTREIMKAAVLSNAASIIVGHNHSSGDPESSPEDINVTKRIAEVGKVIGISLLDQIVLDDETLVSLKEKRHM